MELEAHTSAITKVERIKSAARLRLRVADILNAALGKTQVRRSELARRLGIDRASVTQTLGGNGNITVNTLADYLAAMGLEADIQVVKHGEIVRSMQEHRAPRVLELTIRDTHRKNQSATLTAHTANSSRAKLLSGGLQFEVNHSGKLISSRSPRQEPARNAEQAFRLEKRTS